MPNWKNGEPYFLKTKEQHAEMEFNKNVMKTLARDPEGMNTKLDEAESSGAQVKRKECNFF